MKIARGKVKEYDSYTCPICDWRVKIPRDAARPKVEDVLDWQGEIPDLPFQPEEEEILESIIDQATSFREFLRPFTNPACMTAEEVPTQIFYLRKIEGAEVLLTYETNYFRQEIHKWAPIAPEPPPILEQSLSTRKPRPTKQQKMMVQYGVEKPEDLPMHLRTKHLTFGSKRKSTEPLTGQAPPLQPAPESASSSTPIGDPRRPSTGNAPNSAPLPGMSGSRSSRDFGFSHSYPLTSSGPSPTYGTAPGPLMAPGNNGVHSPTFASSSPVTRHPELDPSLFSPPNFDRNHNMGQESHPTMPNRNDGVDGSAEHANPFGSSPRANMDDLFADLTNQEDVAPIQEQGEEQEEEALEMNHANEALEALNTASNNGTREGSSGTLPGTNGEHDVVMDGPNRDEDTPGALADQFLS